MKKLSVLLLIVIIGVSTTACHFGHGHTTIVEKDNNHYLKIEYSGHVHFSEDGTAISNISGGGYVKYEYNNIKLEARNNGNGVSYELSDDGEKLDPNNNNGKSLIADAVRMMLRKGHHPGQ